MLIDKGDLDEALDYHKRAISIQEKVLDKASPDLATSYNNIGGVLKEKGDLDEALDYYHQALAILEIVSDKDSPLLAISNSNIAKLLYAKGETEKSLEYIEKAVTIAESKFGPDNSHTIDYKMGYKLIQESLQSKA